MGIIRVCTSLIRSLWTLLNIVCGLCTLLAGYGGYINPDKFALAQLANMTFPGWIVLTLILLAVNLFIRKKLAWLSVAVLVACIGPILTISPRNFTSRSLSPDDESRTFTLLTYNVYNFRDNQGVNPEWGNRTLSYILSTDADIVCLQESSNLNGVGKKAQRDSINSRYPYRLYSNRSGEVLLSKYHATEIDTPQPDWGSGSFCAYDVEVEGHEVTVVNCHLQSIGLTDDDKELYRELTDKELRNPSRSELSKVKNGIVTKLLAAFRIRAQQARYIKEFLATRKGNVILVGDFNDVPGSYAYRTIKSDGLKDAYSECAFGPTVTYNDNRFYFRIDQMLYRGDLEAVRIKRGDLRSSDHYPLLATFLWNTAAADTIKR
ncbi:endonuclease/exonuclease/phosphatase family protein [uncultured Muribaculum sp.]|uniref:endonuclease/exonuclease/phosphatase family protein n=1 Tax=uncultured Muribaculum sp. TaxID=1918613 RepID=UPI0025B6765B|nr:endonuclease/exonuclease/phosphatase family protein [uncultured Muribaculum sp.]